MVKQIKYSFRNYMSATSVLLLGTLLINLFFGIMGTLNFWGDAGKITAVVLSSLMFCVVLGAIFIINIQTMNALFRSPMGYMNFLTPVPAWKVLLGQLIPRVILDGISFFLALLGLLWQVFILIGQPYEKIESTSGITGVSLWTLFYIFSCYVGILLLLFFMVTFYKSLPNGWRLKKLITAVAMLLLMYIGNLCFLLLKVTGTGSRWRFLFYFQLNFSFNFGMILFTAILIGEIVALFFLTTYLMERKVNI